MATATKTARTIVSSTASSTQTTGTLSLTTALGCTVTTRVVNGGTGPTTGCLVTLNTSNDGSTWRKYAEYRAGVTGSATYDWTIDLPASVMHVQVDFSATSNSVTKTSNGQELTSVG